MFYVSVVIFPIKDGMQDLKELELSTEADLGMSWDSTTHWPGDLGPITTSFCDFLSVQQEQE